MGKFGKGATAAATGAATGSAFGPIGTAVGAGVGLLTGGINTDGPTPAPVQQVDPAFMQSLYNQAMGTEKTAADAKMKASFDQTLAQQVAAARAARGVNPALLQRNVARAAQEANAKSAQVAEEENIKAQDNARARYLAALQMNQGAQATNSKMDMAAEDRDAKRSGAFLNSLGGIGATFASTMNRGGSSDGGGENTVTAPINTNNYSLYDTPSDAQKINNQYSMGANVNVPQYDTTAMSDERTKAKVKRITAKGKDMYAPQAKAQKVTDDTDMTVMSDERQKDLIKNESLPNNGNLTAQNQAAAQPASNSMTTPMIAAQTAPTSSAPAPTAAPAAPTAATPAPVPASQTALAQANASLSKGGRINDLATQDTSQLVKPADGPDAQTLLNFSTEAQRQQQRDMFGNVTRSDKDIYNQFVNEWYANNAAQKAAYLKQLDDAKTANANINNERAARLAKFYTGTTAVNANDIAQRYAPKVVSGPATDWQSAQEAQTAAGIGNQSHGYNYGGVGSTIGGSYLSSMSDERSKQGIKAEGAGASGDNMNPKDFLDKLTAYSYEYKQNQKNNPKAGPGRHLSVMAQDLEKAGPVGKSMVKVDANGIKNVDYGKGFGAILAAQVQLNERLEKLEKKGK